MYPILPCFSWWWCYYWPPGDTIKVHNVRRILFGALLFQIVVFSAGQWRLLLVDKIPISVWSDTEWWLHIAASLITWPQGVQGNTGGTGEYRGILRNTGGFRGIQGSQKGGAKGLWWIWTFTSSSLSSPHYKSQLMFKCVSKILKGIQSIFFI